MGELRVIAGDVSVGKALGIYDLVGLFLIDKAGKIYDFYFSA